MVDARRGISVLEMVIALAVITVLATSVFTGERGQLRGVGESFDRLAASRAASSRIEELCATAKAPHPGRLDFEPLAGWTGEQVVRRLEPGLFEIEVRVRREGGGSLLVLVTRLAREEP